MSCGKALSVGCKEAENFILHQAYRPVWIRLWVLSPINTAWRQPNKFRQIPSIGSKTLIRMILQHYMLFFLILLTWPRPYLACHRSADCGSGRQTVRRLFSRHAVRPDLAVAPNRRLFRRLPRRLGGIAFRRLYLDVVCRHGFGLAGSGVVSNLPVREKKVAKHVS